MCLLIINMITFFLCGYDKRRSKHHQWRIPERTFFLLSFFGGCYGMYLGMYFFHHKTRKWYFQYGILFLVLGWTILLLRT